MLEVLSEMLETAAKEIGKKVEPTDIMEILNIIEDEYGVELNDDDPITWQATTIVVQEVMGWQKRNR